MASVTRVNGSAGTFASWGRNMRFLTVGKTNITAAQLESILQAVAQQGLTIEAVGGPITFGTTDAVNICVSGNETVTTADLETAAAAAVGSTTVVDMAF